MKVTFLLWSTVRTGGVRTVFEVADRLSLAGHDVSLVSLGGRNHTWFDFKGDPSFVYPEGRATFPVRIRHNFRTVPEALEAVSVKTGLDLVEFRISRLRRSIPSRSEVVIATFCLTAFAASRGLPPGAIGVYYIQHYEPLFAHDEYRRRLVNETYGLPLNWVVNSSWINKVLSDLFKRRGTVVLPGVDAQVFRPNRARELSSQKTVIALGKGARIKGLRYLFDALRLLKTEVPGLNLILYGNEPETALGSPVPTRYCQNPSDPELASLYSAADVAVTPSLWESSPAPPLEAMSCGTPVVTTSAGTEDYCFHEQNALVVPPGDSRALLAALREALTNTILARRLSQEGNRTASHLSWDATALAFERALKSFATNNKSSVLYGSALMSDA